MDENINLFLNELRLQDDDSWSRSGIMLLNLQGLMPESEALQLQSLVVGALALHMLLKSLDMLRCEG